MASEKCLLSLWMRSFTIFVDYRNKKAELYFKSVSAYLQVYLIPTNRCAVVFFFGLHVTFFSIMVCPGSTLSRLWSFLSKV